ncbi:MAG: type VI secretion system tip protein VgrG, partial [Myxococcales bacterium]|nr:type VI secretion system tip protein VgrG [Myxococcales bacterium]
KVVFTDDKAKHKDLKSANVRYHPTSGKDGSAGRHFESFVARHATLPATVKLGDYDYEKPALDVSGSSKVSSSGFGEIRHYGNRFFTPDEGSRIANIRAEELRARGTTYHANGAAVGLSPGVSFTLEDHPHLALNKAYTTTAAEHFGYLADMAAGWGDAIPRVYDDTYRNEVYLIAADLQYRHPSTTPWPRIDGFENGVVDGPASSEYAQIDKSGRYLVKFKFDEGTLKDGKASTYVRMMQPHGGSTEGFHFPLRKQTEVVFIFMGGDPDRPVIAGVVPNAHKPSPVIQSNHTQNIIQTGGGSFITIEDLSNNQFINIYCPTFDTNIYLGCDRPEGPFGTTSGKGPNAVEQGEYKEEMGPFNFQLYTKKNGEIFTQGNLNLIAYKKLQLEGQAGVLAYSGDYWRQHVKGETEEHRVQKVHHRYDNIVDYDWKGPYTLDVDLASTLTYKNTYTRTVTGSSTVSDKSSLTHFIGAEANVCGADTHFLKVQGTEKHHVTGKVTEQFDTGQETNVTGEHKVTITGDQTWVTTGKVNWTIGPDLKITVAGPHEIDSATWHENVFGAKSEFVLGIKNDMVLGAHTSFEGGLKFDLLVGVGIEVSPVKLKSDAMETKLTALQSKIVSTTMRVGTAALKALASGLETYGAMVGPAGFRMH